MTKQKVKNRRGRPPDKRYNIAFLIKKMNDYTDNTDLPILKEFCLQNRLVYKYLNELSQSNADLSDTINYLLMKKEVALEKTLYSGVNNGGAIFGLKQLGWSDNTKIDAEATIKSEVQIYLPQLNNL